MSATVLEFKNPIKPIAHFLRIDDAHRRLGDLYAAGRFSVRRAVFDASRIQSQKDLVAVLRQGGVEIVLDTEVAELAAPAKMSTHVKRAPWAAVGEGGVLHSSYFDGTYSQINIIGWIAKFAVEQEVDVVLAPTHFLADRNCNDWLNIDVQSCLALRKALDSEGGQGIAIDYGVIHSHTLLNQAEVQERIIERVIDLPIDNVWIRASGLGNEPKPQSVRQFIASLYNLQRFEKPVIIDHVDGLMAQALVAFGGVSGLAQGITDRAQFNAGGWHKEPVERDKTKSYGRTTYIPIPGLGRRISSKELQVLASAKGGRKYLSCQDTCCSHGVSDMLADPRQHATLQAIAPIEAMSKIPDLNRENYFLEKPLLDAERLARNVKDLNPSKMDAEKLNVNLESLKKRLSEHHRKIGKFSDALSLLHDERGPGAQRAMTCRNRNISVSEKSGRGQL